MNHRRKIVLFVSLFAVGAMGVRHVGAGALQPHNQAELDAAFVSRSASPLEWDVAGHAFDNQSAHLFWFTDLEAAKEEAKREHKPILSLRLLGKLSDDYSCANSRFFRTALYPNATINKILRQNYVLHWSSERPVPIITIDFGDGRVLKRTLTGNSAHYLMDENGHVLDALPGLYGPGAFAEWLQSGEKPDADLKNTPAAERDAFLQNWHETALRAIYERNLRAGGGFNRLILKEEQYPAEVEKQVKFALRVADGSNDALLPSPITLGSGQNMGPFVPNAQAAGRVALTKSLVEMNTLDLTAPRTNSATLSPLVDAGERRAYGKLARTYLDSSRLDAASRALLLAKLPPGASASRQLQKAQVQTVSETGGEDTTLTLTPAEQTIARFEDAMTFDTARNEMGLHTQIHALFVAGKAGDFQSLNRRIYDRLFLTPSSDPWLGLLPEGVYNGLQNGGITRTKASQTP